MNNNLILLLFLSLSFGLVSCGDDVDCNDEQEIVTLFNDEVDKLNAAIDAWVNDPQNEVLCENTLEAYDDFIDAISDLEDCADEHGRGDDFREALSDARENREDFSCG